MISKKKEEKIIKVEPQIEETTREISKILASGNDLGEIIPKTVEAIFDNKNMLQRSVLNPRLAKALLRAEVYCAYYNDDKGQELVKKIYEVVVSFDGKGRKDLREALQAILGMSVRNADIQKQTLLQR